MSGASAFADDSQAPPTGSSAEVSLSKITKQAKEDLSLKNPFEKAPIEQEEQPLVRASSSTPFTVNRIHLDGLYGLKREDLDVFIRLYEGRKVTLDELNELCARIELEFRRRNYSVVVYLPPQKIEGGEVRLQIMVSKLGEVHLEGVRFFREWKTRSYWKIPKGDPIRFDKIRESVQAMNENPDRRVVSVLRPGKDPGTTDIYLKETDSFPIHFGASYDNHGVKLTGKNRGGFTLRHNNFLGLDDVLMGGIKFGRDFGAGYVQHMLPLTTFGTRLITRFSHSQVAPKKEFKPLGINGISQNFGAEIRQRLYQDEHLYLEGYAGMDFKEKRTRSSGVVSGRDRLRVPSLGLDAEMGDPWGGWILNQSVSFGLAYRDDDTALTSRQAGSSFSKYEFSVKRFQKMFFGTHMVVSVEGQLSPDSLTSQEQLFMGGQSTVRGYAESDYGADQGVITNVEYWIPLRFLSSDWKVPGAKKPLKDSAAILAFVDHGYGRLSEPSGSEHASRNLLGAGVGLDLRVYDHVSMRLEWAFPLGDPGLTESATSQLYFGVYANY